MVRRFASSTLLLVFSACTSSSEEPPVASIPRASTVPRLLPADYVAVGDERPLEWRQADYLRDVLETEIAALGLEVEVENSSDESPGPRRVRATQDRAALATQMLAARAPHDSQPPHAGVLPPIDRFLEDFANETLRSRGYSFATLEAWRSANRRFLESRKLEDRDAALAARTPAFADLSRSIPLRQLLADLEKNPLDDGSRAQALGRLKISYPDSPLPTGGFDTAAQPPRTSGPAGGAPVAAGKAPTATTTPKAFTSSPTKLTGLPRLDGAETPAREIPDLRALLTGASAGAPQK